MTDQQQSSDVVPPGAPQAPIRHGLFIAWKGECFRSRATARTFGVPIELLGAGSGSLRRYAQLMLATWRLLVQRRPSTIFCLNQPPMLPMLCAFWARMNGAVVIQDFHSGAFSHGRWALFRSMYRNTTRHAPVTLAHNREDAARLRAWGAATSVFLTLPDAPAPEIQVAPAPGRPRFLFVCTYAQDEPVQAALDAFAECPEADFWVTGNYFKAGLDPQRMPPNVRLLGFVDYPVYQQAMAGATAVITLSDRPHIMQMAVEEAITFGVPVLTNHSSTLEEALGGAGVFVGLDSPGIAAGVRTVMANHVRLAEQARGARQRCWTAVDAELHALRRRLPDLFT